MFQVEVGGTRLLLRAACALLAGALLSAPAVVRAQAAPGAASLYRIFLRDGATIVSYGEFAAFADRVALTVPVGGSDDAPGLHLITIPQSEVDWERTNAYADAVRARQYAAGQGEADFAILSREVADRLNSIGRISDPAQRLAIAEDARRQLAEWPRTHFGYRVDDIAQMASWLDAVVSELRIAAGHSSFELALVAPVPAAGAAVPLLPAPDLRERVQSGFVAARRAADPAERVSLLRALLEAVAPRAEEPAWMPEARRSASAALEAEMRVDRAYAALADRALAQADRLSRSADVRGLEALVRSVLASDEQLQRLRPAEMGALLATLDARLDGARRLRLARDAWTLRAGLLRDYWRDVRKGLDRLLGLRDWLTDVRQLAGPSPRSLARLASGAALAERELVAVRAPAEIASAHATIQAASGLAARAAATRQDALRSGDMELAWQASAAAAGALMLLEQGVGELRRVTRMPEPAAP